MLVANLAGELQESSLKSSETSSLIKSSHPIETIGITQRWYRKLFKSLWVVYGIDFLEIEEILARIAISKHERTHDLLLDTVVGYQQGNWGYEWIRKGIEWQDRARRQESLNSELASQYWLITAHFYGIAAYPRFAQDQLAGHAELLSNKAYHEAALYATYQRKIVTFDLPYGRVVGILMVPSLEKGPYPTVLVCGSLINMQGLYHHLYHNYLVHAGFAMLYVDFPSVGHSTRLPFYQNYSELHQNILCRLSEIPWIAQNKVVALGSFFGGNVAVRLAYLEPKRLAGVVSVNGLVHQLSVDEQEQQRVFSKIERDIFSIRTHYHIVSEQAFLTELKKYSLKFQGLLGRRSAVPMLAVAYKNSYFSVTEDANLIASSSSRGKVLEFSSLSLKQQMEEILAHVKTWLS